MLRLSYILATILVIIAFNSCSYEFISSNNKVEKATISKTSPEFTNSYGAYLAGRVAHLRKNFDTAADYYIDVLNQNPDNKELLGRIYVMLASKGRVSEAAKYAKLSLEKGDKNNFTHIIIAVDAMKQGNYKAADETIKNLGGPVYQEFITPLLSSWAYAGEGNREKALDTLKILKKEPSFRALYYLHAGMINDYFDNKEEAKKNYEIILNEEHLDMSFRSLQIFTNFYIRNGEKEKAAELAGKISDDRLFIDMLRQLNQNIQDATPENTPKIVNNPNIGLSEALFSISATLRQGDAGVDLAHIFISLSIYANPKYDLAKLLLADILESRGMYLEANNVYDEIPSQSEAYFPAQIKKTNNFVAMRDQKSAELMLGSLALDYPKNPQIFLDLADTLRIQGNHKEAIEYYRKALKSVPKIDNQHWVIFYALAVSYDADKNWKKAESNFQKALTLSHNHYLVLNHLGYSWLQQGKNTNQAFGMIVDAYNQAPQDGNIADSLGWAFYQLGVYDQAVKYLERASEQEPANAVIYNHLGDAYWADGRKNEAIFQWKHALTMEDETGEIKEKELKKKIKYGLLVPTPYTYDKKQLDEKIKEIPQY